MKDRGVKDLHYSKYLKLILNCNGLKARALCENFQILTSTVNP